MSNALSCDNMVKPSSYKNSNTEKSGSHFNSTSGQLENNIYSNNQQISQVVRTIFQDSKGHLWFGTQNGAFKLEGDTLIHLNDIKCERGKGVTIKDIVEDKNGTIWLGHTDGISSINGDSTTNYYESHGLINNDVWCLEVDADNQVWIGTYGGLCIFDGNKFTPFDLPEGIRDTTLGISSTKMVQNINQDSQGTIWLCTNAGLYTYKNKTLTNASKKLGIKTNFINETFEDSKGHIWISTKEHLYQLVNNKLNNITKEKIKIGKGIGSIMEDTNGTIWFVANQHHLYTYENQELQEFIKKEDNKGPVIFKMLKDQSERLWFIGYGGAFRLENNQFVNVLKNGPW